MICFLHGYLLEGSGSNLWTREIIKSICKSGTDVHLVCQENHPENYDFISKLYLYKNNVKKSIYTKKTKYKGKCILHKPFIGNTLPVYVGDKYEEFKNVVPMASLETAKLEGYINLNSKVVSRIIDDYGVRMIVANHMVLMPEVARRAVIGERNVKLCIMPHGSAIEYAVKKDKRMRAYAKNSLINSHKVFVISDEIKDRLNSIFNKMKPELSKKYAKLNLGVDTDAFNITVGRDKLKKVSRCIKALKKSGIGKTKKDKQNFKMQYFKSPLSINKALKDISEYNKKLPDEDLPESLANLNLNSGANLCFMGRLIAAKGLQFIISALPYILDEEKNARLYIFGDGPLREPMELLSFALEKKDKKTIDDLVFKSSFLDDSEKKYFSPLREFVNSLKKNKIYDEYLNRAEKNKISEKIVFCGYLKHSELSLVLPVMDISVFPSIVPEAGPLTFLESLACGCFSMGTYFAGMKSSIDSVRGYLPDNIIALMKLKKSGSTIIKDIYSNTENVLKLRGKYSKSLRRLALDKYDWKNVSKIILSI